MHSFIDSLPERLFRLRAPILGLIALVTIAFAIQIPALKIYTDFEGLLPQKHPFIKVHNEIRGLFGGANVLTVAIEVTDGTIFSNDNLAVIDRVTKAIDNLPGVNHNLVSSITHRTSRFISLTEEGSVRSEVYYNPALGSLTDEQLAAMKAKVLVDPRVFGLSVSPDLKAALIKAQFVDGTLDYLGIFRGLRDIRAGENTAGIRIHTTGQPALIGWVYSYLPQSLQVFAYTAAIILALLVIYFRRFYGVVLPLIGISISTIWGLGWIVLLGYHLDPLMLVIPFLIAARAMSHGIQLVERWYQELARLGDGHKAAHVTLQEMLHPGTLGIVCDAIGLALLVTGSVRINFELGVFTALWAIFSIFNVLIFIPLLLSILPTPRSTVARHGRLKGVLTRLGYAVSHRVSAITITAIGALLVMGSIALSFNITIGESEPGSPLLYRDHDYNLSSTAVNKLFPRLRAVAAGRQGRQARRAEGTRSHEGHRGIQQLHAARSRTGRCRNRCRPWCARSTSSSTTATSAGSSCPGTPNWWAACCSPIWRRARSPAFSTTSSPRTTARPTWPCSTRTTRARRWTAPSPWPPKAPVWSRAWPRGSPSNWPVACWG